MALLRILRVTRIAFCVAGARAQISDAAWSPAGEGRDRPARRGDAGGDCAFSTPSIVEWRGHSRARVHARQMREEMGWTSTSEGELAAFVAYAQASQSITQSVVRNRHRGVQAHEVAPGAQAFPSNFTALVDTYDTIKSGTRGLGAISARSRRDLAPYEAVDRTRLPINRTRGPCSL